MQLSNTANSKGGGDTYGLTAMRSASLPSTSGRMTSQSNFAGVPVLDAMARVRNLDAVFVVLVEKKGRMCAWSAIEVCLEVEVRRGFGDVGRCGVMYSRYPLTPCEWYPAKWKCCATSCTFHVIIGL